MITDTWLGFIQVIVIPYPSSTGVQLCLGVENARKFSRKVRCSMTMGASGQARIPLGKVNEKPSVILYDRRCSTLLAFVYIVQKGVRNDSFKSNHLVHGTGLAFTKPFSRTSLVFFSKICKLECNTASDWLN